MKKIVNVTVLMLAMLLMLMAAGQTALAEEQEISAKEMMCLLDDFVQEIAPEKLDEWLAMFPAARDIDAGGRYLYALRRGLHGLPG